MSGDYSRHSFDPRQDFAGVFMQQGRVQLDADWNELVDVIARRVQAGTVDTFGPAVVPGATAPGFQITASAGQLSIGRGRIYVDGILAENHGAGIAGWDQHLAETIGSQTIDYAAQPYLPGAPALPGGGPHLVYLDVWQREITSVEQPSLIDRAVALDTTTRTQTVWQVKVLPNTGPVAKDTLDLNIPGWLDLTRPSDGRLTTSYVPVANDPNPCSPRVDGGYRGLENQLYRVEVHEGGAPGVATFKWSRDHATVAARVIKIAAADRLTVDSLGKDDVLGFANGDWIEILDDGTELRNEPGELHRISPVGGIDQASRTLTLETGVATFPVNAANPVDPARNIRIRRWDSGGAVATQAGGAAVALENGIAVSFSVARNGGVFKRGDYWVFTARTADATIDILNEAPPRGIHHHYCRLASVTFPANADDLRTFWPPAGGSVTTTEHDGCGCSVCVTAAGHADGSRTIQSAINAVAKTGGTVCIGIGKFVLDKPLQINAASSITLTGQGWQTMIIAPPQQPALVAEECTNLVVERMLLSSAPVGGAPPLVMLRNCTDTALTHCSLVAMSKDDGLGGVAAAMGAAVRKQLSANMAIGLAGFQMGLRIARNMIIAGRGVVRVEARKETYLLTRGIDITQNVMVCDDAGIFLDAPAMHYLDTRITDNVIKGCRSAGIALTGATLQNAALLVSGNHIAVSGHGIVVATSATRIKDNDISGAAAADAHGIIVLPGVARKLDGLQVVGNRIHNVTGNAISLRAPIAWAAIKRNDLFTCGGGIVMEEGAMAVHLALDNNRIDAINGTTKEADDAAVAVRLVKARRADVVGNAISRVGLNAVQGTQRGGIQTIGCETVRVNGNRITGIGPPGQFVGEGFGISVVAPFAQVDITENVVQRLSTDDPDKAGPGDWRAIDIGNAPAGGSKAIGSKASMVRSKNALIVVGERATTVIEDRGPGQVSVRGNQLRAELTQGPAVAIAGAGRVTFAENHCNAIGAVSREPVVAIVQGAVVANGNHVGGTRRPASIAVTGIGRMIGNIVTSPILLNGNPLPPPFDDLNLIAP